MGGPRWESTGLELDLIQSSKSNQDAKRQKGPELEFQMTTHDDDVNRGMWM